MACCLVGVCEDMPSLQSSSSRLLEPALIISFKKQKLDKSDQRWCSVVGQRIWSTRPSGTSLWKHNDRFTPLKALLNQCLNRLEAPECVFSAANIYFIKQSRPQPTQLDKWHNENKSLIQPQLRETRNSIVQVITRRKCKPNIGHTHIWSASAVSLIHDGKAQTN